DPKPAPGTLTLSFPDGTPPEVTNINTILGMPGMNGTPITLTTANGGDYPTDAGTTMNPLTYNGGGTPNGSTVVAGSIYDWLKRVGARLDASQAVGLVTEPLNNVAGAPSMHIFSIKANGGIQYDSSLAIVQNPYWVASENQLYGQQMDALTSSD